VFEDLTNGIIKTYEPLIKNYETAMSLYSNHLQNNKAFAKFMEEQKSINRERYVCMDLQFFLIQPVQRVPKYILLLRDLVKYTPSHHCDYLSLQKALAQMEKVADHLNEEKRKAETAAKLVTVQGKLLNFDDKMYGTLWQDGRKFLREGTLLQMYCNGPGSESRYGYFFLFSDILIHTKQKNKMYKVENVYKIEDIPFAMEVKTTSDVVEENQFIFFHKKTKFQPGGNSTFLHIKSRKSRVVNNNTSSNEIKSNTGQSNWVNNLLSMF